MSSSLRKKIQALVVTIIALSVCGSALSLYRVSEVGQSFVMINSTTVPLGQLLAQLKADADLLKREIERGAEKGTWESLHWKPKPIPGWIFNIVRDETQRLDKMIQSSPELNQTWKEWSEKIRLDFDRLQLTSEHIKRSIEKSDVENASVAYRKWQAQTEEWVRQLNWGIRETDRVLQGTFNRSMNQVLQLRTGLEVILAAIVLLSFLMVWMGEKTLRPLGELTSLAREIAQRGLRREDKAMLPAIHTQREDEVGQLAREFERMATALLEREKDLEMQKSRIQEQNVQLREMGRINKNILASIRSAMIVTDLDGRITHCNPTALSWLKISSEELIGTQVGQIASVHGIVRYLNGSPHRIDPFVFDGKIAGGRTNPLYDEAGHSVGYVVILDDLTEEVELQQRLQEAENLAAMGRLSAQVAHEIRNPLHSIGLEAEITIDLAQKHKVFGLKQCGQSILASVDRLEKIIQNYLKLSKLSSGKKASFLLTDLLQSVLATYAPVCESQGVSVSWSIGDGVGLKAWGDQDLLEQVLGNLLKNSLQALDQTKGVSPKIDFKIGATESGGCWMSISDNGPGLSEEIRNHLFTPFVTTKAQGTGLGLSFAKKVMDDHRGKIECVASGIDGQGASFVIVFPPFSEMSEDIRPKEESEKETSQ